MLNQNNIELELSGELVLPKSQSRTDLSKSIVKER